MTDNQQIELGTNCLGDHYRRGAYGELAVAAAFVSKGCQVAFPIGASPGWDLVAKIGKEWKTVQVKCASLPKDGSRYPKANCCKVSVHGTKRVKVPYTADDVDVLVIVNPETGAMWLFPQEAFVGKKSVTAAPKYAWVNVQLNSGVTQTVLLPASSSGIDLTYKPVKSSWRERLKGCIPVTRPESCRPDTWLALQDYSNGQTLTQSAKDHGMSYDGFKRSVYIWVSRFNEFQNFTSAPKGDSLQ